MKLYYFTDSYPFGRGNMWKEYELDVLKKYFSSITVVPLHSDGNINVYRSPPTGVKFINPLFNILPNTPLKPVTIFKIFNRHFFTYLSEAIRGRIVFSKKRIIAWLSTILFVQKLFKVESLRKLLQESDEDTVYYFYWGRGTADIVPYIKEIPKREVVIKMHRYDLFEYVNDNYIPFRLAQIRYSNIILPCSTAGANHLTELYPRYKEKFYAFPCGTRQMGLALASSDGILRIISCAWCRPVKRIHLIIEALSLLPANIKIIWQHLGGGEMLNELKSLAAEIVKPNCKVIFEGAVPVEKVISYYVNKEVDLFINVSSSEGVPISIMEAMSAGIPIFATNVGGTGEIVNNTVGRLLDADVDATTLKNEIENFYNLNSIDRDIMRKKSYEGYCRKSDSDVLTEKLGQLLLK